MALSSTLFKTMRKLLRFGASTRAARIADKLSADEIATLLTMLSRGESLQLVDVLLGSSRIDELLRELPSNLPEFEQALASIPDIRLVAFLMSHPAPTAKALLRRLPESRCHELRCSIAPEYAPVIDEHLRGRRRPSTIAVNSFRDRIATMLSFAGVC